MISSSLKGQVALVAGATRGAGRGIAIELGSRGATVYVTGRSTKTARSEYDRPETIEDTATMVSDAGGIGIPVQVDHTDYSKVETLRDTISESHGKLNILVNDIWGGEGSIEWGVPIWEQRIERGIHILRNSTESHIITNHLMIPLLIKTGNGVLLEISDGTLDYNLENYRTSLFYDLAKLTINRIAWAMSKELAEVDCTAIGITPGWLRSEMMLDGFGVTESTWRDAIKDNPGFEESETPRFVGRAVAYLASDPDVRRFNGQSLNAYQVSEIYGFTDVDGRRPNCWQIIQNGG